jgi:hypothetical protein
MRHDYYCFWILCTMICMANAQSPAGLIQPWLTMHTIIILWMNTWIWIGNTHSTHKTNQYHTGSGTGNTMYKKIDMKSGLGTQKNRDHKKKWWCKSRLTKKTFYGLVSACTEVSSSSLLCLLDLPWHPGRRRPLLVSDPAWDAEDRYSR